MLRNFKAARADFKDAVAEVLNADAIGATCPIFDDYIPETVRAPCGVAATLQNSSVEHVLDGGEQTRFTWSVIICAKSRDEVDELMTLVARIDRMKSDYFSEFVVEGAEDLPFNPGNFWYAGQMTIVGIR